LLLLIVFYSCCYQYFHCLYFCDSLEFPSPCWVYICRCRYYPRLFIRCLNDIQLLMEKFAPLI
jgi:hypothetical protein